MIKRSRAGLDIFSEKDLEKIHEATLEVLEKAGVEIMSDEAREIFKSAGVKVNEKSVHLTQKDLDEYLNLAPEKFTLYARNEQNNVEIGGNNTVLAPGYGSPFVMDYPEMNRRESKYDDYIKFTKLAQASDNIDVVGGVLVEPTDIDDKIRHGKMLEAAVKYSDKCLMGSAMGAKKAQESLEMAAIVFESEEFVRSHPVLISLINTNSPLTIDERMSDALMVHSKNKQAMVIASLSMTGTTSPTTLPASLVQQNAEILTGIVLTQLINPGTPVIYGSASSVVDLKKADLALGSPETVKMFNGTAQMARYYGIPSRGGGALTDSLFPDAQAGYESMLNIMSAVNNGFNFILHAAGLLENYMSMSYEKFIIDDEVCGIVNNVAEGLIVDEDQLAVDEIIEIGAGGNYISTDHTFSHMKDMRMPLLSKRERYFSDQDQPETAARAKAKYEEILNNFNKPELKAGILEKLQKYIDRL
ncbi:trimethylamine methyltransferase family protein [Halanaerobiaceae bacterium Z-7014]|uniref:Methyltransferase n=1 Tax=Halonatronomonas betaini TaxID=2778430 RepID=A0A931FAZ6_9FIRM|nr:trimethylamine methyltransferase family protein [Halonatronomonas betaini]MBF8438179.1 trimethylamine methyltransferase family protein [Halonatronomonas betaini]